MIYNWMILHISALIVSLAYIVYIAWYISEWFFISQLSYIQFYKVLLHIALTVTYATFIWLRCGLKTTTLLHSPSFYLSSLSLVWSFTCAPPLSLLLSLSLYLLLPSPSSSYFMRCKFFWFMLIWISAHHLFFVTNSLLTPYTPIPSPPHILPPFPPTPLDPYGPQAHTLSKACFRHAFCSWWRRRLLPFTSCLLPPTPFHHVPLHPCLQRQRQLQL